MFLRLKLIAWCCFSFFSFGANWVQSQTPVGTSIENFRVSEKSLDNQRSTILTGEKALFLEGGIMSLSNPRLVTVTSKGKTNLVFNASECLYNQETKTISSPGQMSLSTSDGQMQLSGLGFSGSLIGPSLTIATNVKANLKKSLKDVSFRNIPDRVAIEGTDMIDISAKQFEMIPGKAEFRDSVIVKDVEVDLRADVIKIEFQNEDGLIRSVEGFGDIEIESDKVLITNKHVDSRASYDLESGSILIKGSPSWLMGENSGRADSIMIHRESMFISAYGNVEMKVPISDKEGGLFQFNPVSDTESESNSLLLNISSSYFVFQPAKKGKKGYARYIGSVKLIRGITRLDCQYLNFVMYKESNKEKLETARATGVNLYQGDDLLASNLLFYDFENEKLILEASPNWILEGQTGNAKRVEIDTKSGKFLAKGNVEMELTKTRGIANFLFPMDEGKSSSEDNSPTSVTCDLFEYIRSFENSHFDTVKFNGDVFLTGKNGFNLKANSIYMEIDSIKKDLNIINAIGDLSGTTIGQNSMRFNGGRLNYDKNSKIVRLLGNPHVEIHTEQDGAEVVAFGSEAQYKTEEGSMVLLGNPLLKTPQGVLGGDRVVYDQKEKRLRASGNWKMTLSSKLILQKRDKSD